MKHTKIFFALLVLAAALFAFGCNQANTPGNGSGFTMNEHQKQAYNAQITTIALTAATQEIPANMVKIQLQTINEGFKSLKFKVVDTKEGEPIAKGTDENALKARFKPAAL